MANCARSTFFFMAVAVAFCAAEMSSNLNMRQGGDTQSSSPAFSGTWMDYVKSAQAPPEADPHLTVQGAGGGGGGCGGGCGGGGCGGGCGGGGCGGGCGGCGGCGDGGGSSNKKEYVPGNAPNLPEGVVFVEMFVMSKCPYGTQAEEAMWPAMRSIGLEHVHLQLEWITDIVSTDPPKFSSMHGRTEVLGDKWQACAIDMYREHNKYIDFISCMNYNSQLIPSDAGMCAKKTGVDYDKLQQCVDGQKGDTLLLQSYQNAAEAGVTSSPTIYINGKQYQYDYKSEYFMWAICQAYPKGKAPAPCNTS